MERKEISRRLMTFAMLMMLQATLFAVQTFAQQDTLQSDTLQQEPVIKYGFLSYEEALQSMPEYAQMLVSMQQLRSQYEAEQKRVTLDFNNKYEEFLDGQANFPRTILQKRQSELQELLDRNIAFKKEGLQLLEQAREEALAPLRQKLADVLATIGEQRGYAFILNTDGNAMPWLNAAMGEDISTLVKDTLQQDVRDRK